MNVNLEDCWLQMTVSRILVHSAGVHCSQKSSVAPLTAAEILLSLPVTLRPTDPLQLHLCLICNIKCPIYNWIYYLWFLILCITWWEYTLNRKSNRATGILTDYENGCNKVPSSIHSILHVMHNWLICTFWSKHVKQ